MILAILLMSASCQNTSAEAATYSTADLSGTALSIEVNGHTLTATWNDNSSAAAFVARLKEGPVTVSMHDYGDFEKVGPLGFSLPRNDTSITTVPGDVILYQGNQITIYYDTNSWSFTRLACINDTSNLRSILGSGNVTVTFSITEQE